MVAGTGLEPVNKGYEPFEFPVTLSGDVVWFNQRTILRFYLSCKKLENILILLSQLDNNIKQ